MADMQPRWDAVAACAAMAVCYVAVLYASTIMLCFPSVSSFDNYMLRRLLYALAFTAASVVFSTSLLDLAISILVAGILCIYINYDCDRQRQEFRRTNGKCLIWGRAPSKIVASYQTTKGETKNSLLLTSGWWGLARHFHYAPEISAAFFWSVPALFSHFLPYFYVIFLTILLFDRAKRDDDRCSSKYKKYWKLYCDKVPYRIVPGIY